MNYLEIPRLEKQWQNKDATQSFSLDFSICIESKGQMLGIAGQSGSGKSTILRLISGLLKNDSSAPILLNGTDISRLAPAKRGIGMVFQTPSLFPHLRVDDNVAYGLRHGKPQPIELQNLSKSESRKIAAAFLEKFNLQHCAERYPDTLSGGEAQRVSLARTLIMRPSLVLFDEPFSALDAPLKKKLAADIKKMQAETGFTGILVTHDINEAKSMCNKITVMRQGKQTWTGKPEDFSENTLLF